MMSILNWSILVTCSKFSLVRAGLPREWEERENSLCRLYVAIVLLLHIQAQKPHKQMKSIEMRTESRKRNEKDGQRQRVYRDIQRRQTTGVHGLLNWFNQHNCIGIEHYCRVQQKQTQINKNHHQLLLKHTGSFGCIYTADVKQGSAY